MSTNVNVRQRTNIAISTGIVNEKWQSAVGPSTIVKHPRKLVWDQEVESSNLSAPIRLFACKTGLFGDRADSRAGNKNGSALPRRYRRTGFAGRRFGSAGPGAGCAARRLSGENHTSRYSGAWSKLEIRPATGGGQPRAGRVWRKPGVPVSRDRRKFRWGGRGNRSSDGLRKTPRPPGSHFCRVSKNLKTPHKSASRGRGARRAETA